MKVKITATVSLETEVYPEDYSDLGSNPTVDQIISFELKQMQDSPYECAMGEQLMTDGNLSDIKIEKVQEAAPAQPEAA